MSEVDRIWEKISRERGEALTEQLTNCVVDHVEVADEDRVLVHFREGATLDIQSWGAYGESSGLDVEVFPSANAGTMDKPLPDPPVRRE